MSSPTLFLYVFCILFLAGRQVSCRQDGDKNDDSFFDEDFYDYFEESDRRGELYNRVGEGKENWERRCLEIGGQEALNKWHRAQEDVIYCFLKNFNSDKIYNEMEVMKKRGDLDLFFKKYCGDPVNKTLPCVDNFLKASQSCQRPEDRDSLKVTKEMIDAAIGFICHNSGDRLALFMSENGMDCLQSHQDQIINCISDNFPAIFQKKVTDVHQSAFNSENCRKGDLARSCVERELLKCPDPTPANVVDSLFRAVRDATPCSALTSGAYVRSDALVTLLLLPILVTTNRPL